ncbi:MAG: DNA mismatch repair endonuclease MutL [Bacteroidales bacterium]|jgi:DNA mismatch repair protein MutL|nr:DNA mismatch repair endonuclease MutL [Bacteroidales bacterium]MCI1786401.1 DNA mismatch repair endonuclease MutL [Bacteroidales bacterium]
MDIRILPSNIANVIAAGEVVSRPSSVVKELVENAVDAGASCISVAVTDSGRTLVKVTDDGCGMTPDEAVLCFERHATSKIFTAEDLNNILTFGFRGEALASIAAVSDVTLRTRREEDETGCEVEFSASKHVSTKETAAPKGSCFSVRNIFYNVPARRKFLKSDAVEFKHIVEEFTRVALTRPDISFSLNHNGKDIFILKPAKSLKFRILDLLGSNVAGDIVDISAETTIVRIHGYIGRPESARKTLGNQFLFVNGRFFRSPYMHKAVMKAYEDMIPDGTSPSYFIYMDMDPHSIDVNISPTKTEIKFEDDSVIFQILYACVKEILGKNAFAGGLDFDREGAAEIPVFGKNFEEYHPVRRPEADIDPEYNPFDRNGADGNPIAENVHAGESSRDLDFSKFVDKREDYSRLFEDKFMPSSQIIVLQNKYIIVPVKSGLMAVNIRRANERILYEKFLTAVSGNGHVTQTSLFPVSIQVGVANRAVFDANSDLLSSLGFDISPFGNDSIVVNGVPEGYSAEQGKVETMMADLLLILNDGHISLSGMMASSIAEKFAVLGAGNCSVPSSSAEAGKLIDSLFASGNSEFTSSGHRIVAIIPADDIDKKF